ncbi:MAG: methyltransferase [Candidatus Competibacteraceae bacterium]|nr:methyltransferase [Candidatus Competibacteraceae bacterium]
MSSFTPFIFKHFFIRQQYAAFKIGTDSVLLGAWGQPQSDKPIVDIGCGTGILTLMMAQRTQSALTAIDCDPLSLKDAAYNFEHSPWNHRIKMVRDDAKKWAKIQTREYGYMISNPPYFSQSLRNSDIRKSKARHNDSLSNLDIIQIANNILLPEGIIALILPVDEMKIFMNDAYIHRMYPQRICFIKHTANKNPKRCMAEFTLKKQKPEISTFTLFNNDQTPTEAYLQLTKDFYL